MNFFIKLEESEVMEKKVKLKSTENKLYSVCTAEQMFKSAEYTEYIDKIRGWANLEKAHFDGFYMPLLNKFAEYVQFLPESSVARPKRMLTVGLQRAGAMLKHFSEHIQGGVRKQMQRMNQDPDLFAYMAFSAGLLFEIGSLCSDSKVFIADARGRVLCNWSPFDDAMLNYGEYYKIRYARSISKTLIQLQTPIIAQMIMPKVGFAWIAQDAKLLEVWLNSLSVIEEAFGMLDKKYEVEKVLASEPELPELADNAINPEETAMAEEFWAWLKEQIEANNLTINEGDSFLHMVEGGLLIEHVGALKAFARDNSHYRNLESLYLQFNHLGLTDYSMQDYRFSRYLFKNPDSKPGMQANSLMSQFYVAQSHQASTFAAQEKNKMIEGLLITQPGMYFDLAAMPKPDQNLHSQEGKSALSKFFSQFVSALSMVSLLPDNSKQR